MQNNSADGVGGFFARELRARDLAPFLAAGERERLEAPPSRTPIHAARLACRESSRTGSAASKDLVPQV
jgi:hypothetical protein